MNNNRNNNRRRGRGNRNQSGGGNNQNRIDSRARGNAPQLLDKYKKLAQDAQHNGDRVQMEYYLQFADHYFRVIADNKARMDESRGKRPDDRSQANDDGDDDDDFDFDNRRDSSRRPRGRRDEQSDFGSDEGEPGFEGEPIEADEEAAAPPRKRTPRPQPKPKPKPNPSANASADVNEGGDEPKRRKPRANVRPRRNAEGSSGGIDSAVLPPSIGGGAADDDGLKAVG